MVAFVRGHRAASRTTRGVSWPRLTTWMIDRDLGLLTWEPPTTMLGSGAAPDPREGSPSRAASAGQNELTWSTTSPIYTPIGASSATKRCCWPRARRTPPSSRILRTVFASSSGNERPAADEAAEREGSRRERSGAGSASRAVEGARRIDVERLVTKRRRPTSCKRRLCTLPTGSRAADGLGLEQARAARRGARRTTALEDWRTLAAERSVRATALEASSRRTVERDPALGESNTLVLNGRARRTGTALV